MSRRPTAEEILVFGAEALGVTPDGYREIVGEEKPNNHLLRSSPPHISLRPPRTSDYAHSLRAEGKRGQVVKIEQRLDFLFRPSIFRATDSSTAPGRATRISLRIGQEVAFTLIPTWLFWDKLTPDEIEVCRDANLLLATADETESVRRQAALPGQEFTVRNLRWATWYPGLSVEVEVHFDEPCRWDGVFIGKTIK